MYSLLAAQDKAYMNEKHKTIGPGRIFPHIKPRDETKWQLSERRKTANKDCKNLDQMVVKYRPINLPQYLPVSKKIQFPR